MSTTLLPILLLSAAMAQGTPPTNVVHAPVPDETPAPPAPPAPAPPPAEPARMGDYWARSLRIGPVFAFAPARPAPVRVGVGWSSWGPRSAWHVGVGVPVVAAPLNPAQPWAVYQDQRRLTVPEYLNTVGDQARFNALTHDLQRSRTWSNVWLGTAGAGAVALVGGLISASGAQTNAEYGVSMNVAGLGCLAIAGGLVGRSIATAHAYELENDYKETLTLPEVEGAVQSYNDRLRGELGLGPEDVKREPPKRGRR